MPGYPDDAKREALLKGAHYIFHETCLIWSASYVQRGFAKLSSAISP